MQPEGKGSMRRSQHRPSAEREGSAETSQWEGAVTGYKLYKDRGICKRGPRAERGYRCRVPRKSGMDGVLQKGSQIRQRCELPTQRVECTQKVPDQEGGGALQESLRTRRGARRDPSKENRSGPRKGTGATLGGRTGRVECLRSPSTECRVYTKVSEQEEGTAGGPRSGRGV